MTNWVRCCGGGGSSGGSERIIRKVYAPTTAAASETYTITEDGLYVIIAGTTHKGTYTLSLPSNRTAIVSGDIVLTSSGFTRGMAYAVANLKNGDVVTIGSTPDSWVGHGRFIMKLEGIEITSGTPVSEIGVADNMASYTIPDNSPYFLIGFACSKPEDITKHYCKMVGDKSDTSIDIDDAGVRCDARFSYSKNGQGNIYKSYGYDGASAIIVVLSASV